MNLDFNWINLLILFGALQGLLFGIILLFNKKHPGAKFLSIFMFVLAYNGFETFNWSSQLGKYFIFFDLFPFVLIYAPGPSLYLYIRSLFYPEEKWSWKNILPHYAPAAFQFTFRFSIVIVYLLIINHVINDKALLESMVRLYYLYSEPLSVIVFIVYLYLSLKMFMKVRTTNKIPSVSKEMQQEIYKWVRALLLFMIIIGVAWPLTVLAPYIFDLSYDVHYYPIELGLVAFIYWIAFVGFLRMKIIFKQTPKISTNFISTIEVERFMVQLLDAMKNDKLYLNPALNRDKLAAYTGINAKTISATLNQHLQQNFNDFVNNYRVNEVCERLLLDENQHLTISSIALEAGFNSQATFQRAFKNVTGKSPREYLKERTKKESHC